MKKTVSIFAFNFFTLIFFFINTSSALSIGDLATLDKEKIEGAVGDNFGMPDYEQMLEEESIPEETSIFEEFVPEQESLFSQEEILTETLENEPEAKTIIQKTKSSFSSSAPLTKSGPGNVIVFALTILISSFLLFNRTRSL